eukprot:173532_1
MSSFSWEDAHILAIIMTTAFIYFYLALIIKFGTKFAKYRNEISLYKRYASLTIKATSFCIIELIFAWIFEILDTMCYLYCNNGYKGILYARQIAWLLFLIFNQIVCHYFILREWILYYQIMIIQTLWDNQWKEIIIDHNQYFRNTNTNSKSKSKNKRYKNNINIRKNKKKKNYNGFKWYISNQKTYGNISWICKRLCFCSLIPLIFIGPIPYCIEPLIFGWGNIGHYIVMLTNAIAYFVPCIILFIIYYKIPKKK